MNTLRKGGTWNECQRFRDPVTGRRVIGLTTAGERNNTPTYHTNTAFSADGERLIFATRRDGRSALCAAAVTSGDLTCLTEPVSEDVYGGACLAPRSGWCVHRVGCELRAVHLDTFEERRLWVCDEGWGLGMPSVDGEERTAVVPVVPLLPPELRGAADPRAGFRYWAESGKLSARLMRVPLDGSGKAREVYCEAGVGCNHVQVCPEDPDLAVLDRDFPPMYSWGGDGRRNRTWALRFSTGKLTEMAPRCRRPFQVHGTWIFDSDMFLFHGWWGNSNHAGWYFSALTPDGKVVREFHFPEAAHYGHVTAATDRMAFILDGNLTSDLLLWLHYGAKELRIEIIGRHGTEWDSLPGQLPHPHPLASPCMRWISYNAARAGRTDVHVLAI